MNLSRHVTYEQATQSSTATLNHIENKPSPAELENMKRLATEIIDKIIDAGFKIKINSFYRCKELNEKVGGAITSQHISGNACDITTIDGKNQELFLYIKDNFFLYDQLIREKGDKYTCQWVHVSLKRFGNRKQVLYT